MGYDPGLYRFCRMIPRASYIRCCAKVASASSLNVSAEPT